MAKSNETSSKYSIKNLDFLGDKFKIGYSTPNGKFQSKLGGYITILMGVLSTSMFFVVMSQFFTKSSPVVMTSSEFGSKISTFNLYKENLFLLFGFGTGPQFVDGIHVSRYVTIKAELTDAVTNFTERRFIPTPFRKFDYKICQHVKDQQVQDYVGLIASEAGVEKYWSCPDFQGLGNDFVVHDNYENHTHKWLSIKVYPCSLEDRSQCASAEEIDEIRNDYTFALKLLQPSDAETPVRTSIIRESVNLDRRSTKDVKMVVRLNRVLDGTLTTLIPPSVKLEYATIQEEKVDLKRRPESQVYCTKAQIDQGPAGGCREYVSYDYVASSEVLVTLRSYKKLTTMLGEYGGLLKIMTTLVFFFYGFYSLRKVKSIMSGIIFKTDQEKEKRLEKLIGGKNHQKNHDHSKYNQVVQRVEEAKPDSNMNSEADGPEYKKVMKHLIDRRSNVDNLMEKLNFLELIEKAVLQDDAKTLVPLALLQAEKMEMQKAENQSAQPQNPQEKEEYSGTRSTNTIFRRNQMTPNGSEPYKQAFDHLVNSNPNSQLGMDIKNYLVSLLEPKFKPQDGHLKQKIGLKYSQRSINLKKKLIRIRMTRL